MTKDKIKAFLKDHPQATHALFGGLLLAQGVIISPLANHIGTAGP